MILEWKLMNFGKMKNNLKIGSVWELRAFSICRAVFGTHEGVFKATTSRFSIIKIVTNNMVFYDEVLHNGNLTRKVTDINHFIKEYIFFDSGKIFSIQEKINKIRNNL